MKEDKRVPELRFPEFSGGYKKRLLGDEFEFIKNYSYSRNDEGNGIYHHIHYGDIHSLYSGYIENETYVPSIINTDKHVELKNGDIVIADASEDYKDLGKALLILNKGDKKLIAGLHTFALRSKSNIIPNYFFYYTKAHSYRRYISKVGTGTSVFGINRRNLESMELIIPQKREQQKIGNFFFYIDKKLELQQERIDILKEYKKGMMQKIFSQEIRFKDENGENYPDWEEVEMGDISSVSQGLQIPINKRFQEEGCNRYFYITNEFLKLGSKAKYYIENPPQNVICSKDDILMTRTGNTGIVLTNVEGAFHNNFFKIDFDRDKLNKDFLVLMLNSYDIQKDIIIRAGGSTILDLNHSEFYKVKIYIPDMREQKKVVKILSSIDKKIELEEERLEEYKKFKKGLMQRMFV